MVAALIAAAALHSWSEPAPKDVTLERIEGVVTRASGAPPFYAGFVATYAALILTRDDGGQADVFILWSGKYLPDIGARCTIDAYYARLPADAAVGPGGLGPPADQRTQPQRQAYALSCMDPPPKQPALGS